MIQWIGRDTSY